MKPAAWMHRRLQGEVDRQGGAWDNSTLGTGRRVPASDSPAVRATSSHGFLVHGGTLPPTRRGAAEAGASGVAKTPGWSRRATSSMPGTTLGPRFSIGSLTHNRLPVLTAGTLDQAGSTRNRSRTARFCGV